MSKKIRSFSHTAKLLSAGLLLGLGSQTWALNKVITVSATVGKGDFPTIQAAVNSCDPVQDVCTINILDAMTLLNAPVWIEGKANITLQGGLPGGGKPIIKFNSSLYALVANPNAGQQAQVAKLFTLSWAEITNGPADPQRPAGWLMWPFKGSSTCSTPTNGPMGLCSDTSSPYSTSGFQHNGMIVVKKSRDIALKNLNMVSNPIIFQNSGIWSGMYDIVAGTIGIDIFQSLRVDVEGNEISGFFSAMYINGRNVGGMFGSANPDDWDVANIVPLSRYGQVGDHNIWRNYLHDNWWGFYIESSWDKSSRIHHNVAYNNMNKSFQYLDSLKVASANSSEMNNQTGGFGYLKDAVLATDRIYNNTILRTPIILGFGGWRAGSQELIYNNVIRGSTEADALAGTKLMSDWHQLIQYYGPTVWDNTFQLHPGAALTYTVPKNVQITDATITGVNGPGSTCSGGCWMTISPTAKVSYVSQIQPQFLWNGWMAKQGVDYVVQAADITWPAGSAGYTGKSFTIHDNNGYNPWGLVSQMFPTTMTAATVTARNNLWAMSLPTTLDSIKPDTSFKQASPTNVLQLAPRWSDVSVDSTIRNKAWYNDNLGNTDGTPSDRGAFCYDTLTGKTIFGCQRGGPVLSLVDQQIVNVQGTSAKIPVILQQVDGLTGAASSGFSNFKIDSVYYYDAFPFSKIPAKGANAADESKLAYAIPSKIIGVTWSGTSGGVASLTLPNAVTNDYARFDVFLSATDPTTGKTVSVIGVYFYRKLQYLMGVKFCSTAACTDSLTTARVGDPIFMQAYIIDAATGAKLPSQQISRVYVTPSGTMRDMTIPPGTVVDTSQFLASATGSFVAPVDFETRGNISVTVAGLVGASSSAIGVLGIGSINIRPGLPYNVQFVAPIQTSQTTKCNGNPSDTTNTTTCNEIQSVVPNQGSLLVTDKYSNPVDTAATVILTVTGAFSGTIASPSSVSGSVVKLGATQAGVSSGSTAVNVQTDATGNAAYWVSGDPGSASAILYASKPPVYPWIQLNAVIQASYAVGPNDLAYARLDPPAGHLQWSSPAKINAYILTPQPVVLILTKDGSTVDVGNANANAKVAVYAYSSYIKAYADSAMTTPLDSVQLTGGQVKFWLASTKPVQNDTLYAASPVLNPTNPGLPVSFTSPPVPPTPTLKSAVFLDGNCDGIADAAVVTFDPNGAVPTLDTTKVKISRIKLATAAGDSVILDATNFTVNAGGASISISIPASAQSKFAAYNPSGTVELWANLVRPPAADTNVYMGKTSVSDGIGPRPMAATMVENDVPGAADTLKVQFSEPVKYAGTAFPFHLFPSGMGAELSGSGLAVTNVIGSGTSNLTFVVTGNTGSLAAGDVVSIFTGKGITDLAGNDGRYSPCVNDTTHVVLVPVAVPITSAWISDLNGDGKADQITVIFRRAFLKPTEAPDSLVVSNWVGAPTTTLPWSAAVPNGTATFTFPISFPEGATVGNGPNGSGTITLAQGPIRREPNALVDSVPPVAIGVAKLSHGLIQDTLVVTYSEPIKPVPGGSIWMGRKPVSGADDPLVLSSNSTGSVWTYAIQPGYVLAGDSIRMSITKSVLAAADNGQLPASTGSAPYIPVAGGDRAPDSAIVLDLNGDGTADAIRLVYLKPLIGNPTFSFTWGGVTVRVDSMAYKTSLPLAGTKGAILTVSGFPAGVTAGPGQGTSTSLVAGSASTPLPFTLIDGVAPVLNSVYVTYGQTDGAPDTILVKVSEPLSVSPPATNFLTIARKGDVKPFMPSGPASVLPVDATTYKILCDSCVDGSGFFGLPGFGDSAKLMTGVKDAPLNAVGDTSRWVAVLTGPYPIRYTPGVYPKGGVFVSSNVVPPEIQNLPDVTSWILPVGSDSSGIWTSVDAGANGGISTMDAPTAKGGLFGIFITTNSSLDGQVLYYDNLGVFVGKIDLKTDKADLLKRGLVGPDGKYTVVVSLKDNDDKNRHLASGIYMARLISFSVQTVNGVQQRVMIQNKLYKVGYKKNLK